MAIDVYLRIDGIKGESNDDRHKDWIECKSVRLELSQPKSATASLAADILPSDATTATS